jgi:hypothetical protein
MDLAEASIDVSRPPVGRQKRALRPRASVCGLHTSYAQSDTDLKVTQADGPLVQVRRHRLVGRYGELFRQITGCPRNQPSLIFAMDDFAKRDGAWPLVAHTALPVSQATDESIRP